MKIWLLPLVPALAATALWHWSKELKSFLLDPAPFLPPNTMQEETARLLFRDSALPNAQASAREHLLQQAALRSARLADPSSPTVPDSAVETEWDAWQRQWENDADRRARLTLQGLDADQMRQTIRNVLLDRAWLEQQISPAIHITEQELQVAFARQKQSLELPLRHRVSHLFLSRHGPAGKDRHAEMAHIHHQMMTGQSWDKLVNTHSEDPRSKPSGGDLGWVTRQRMPTPFMAAVESLQPGQTSGPVATPLGWHLIRLQERLPARMPRFDEVREELRTALAQQKREAAVVLLLQRLAVSHRSPGAAL